MMLRHSFKMEKEARAVEAALDKVLADGLRTPDIQGAAPVSVGTRAFGKAVLEALAGAPALVGRGSR
jgi:3-isopropylmalate dehydrogenase